MAISQNRLSIVDHNKIINSRRFRKKYIILNNQDSIVWNGILPSVQSLNSRLIFTDYIQYITRLKLNKKQIFCNHASLNKKWYCNVNDKGNKLLIKHPQMTDKKLDNLVRLNYIVKELVIITFFFSRKKIYIFFRLVMSSGNN